MKIILLTLALFWAAVNPANAYLEDERGSRDAEATAGEQNTNLRRLQAMQKISVKRLKKIDDALAKEKLKNVANTDLAALEEMLNGNEDKKFMTQALKNIQKAQAKPADLVVAVDFDVYKNFTSIRAQNIYDAEAAKQLRQTLPTRRLP